MVVLHGVVGCAYNQMQFKYRTRTQADIKCEHLKMSKNVLMPDGAIQKLQHLQTLRLFAVSSRQRLPILFALKSQSE